MSWVLTILGIAALIVLHEAGHFAVAKAVGMRVERFSLFFPPKLVGIRRGETEYMIGAIPAGGYVKITGMSPQELEGLDPAVAQRAYYNQPPWKRIVVILAGPGVNLLIAFLLFWAILFSGSLAGMGTLEQPQPLDPHARSEHIGSRRSRRASRLTARSSLAIGSSAIDGKRVYCELGDQGDRRPPLCRGAARGLSRSHARAVDRQARGSHGVAVGVPPL